MLSPVQDVSFGYQPQLHGHGWLVIHVGEQSFRLKRMEKLEFRSIRRWAEQAPQRVAAVDQRVYWMFEGRYFADDEGLTQRQVHDRLRTRLAS